jgi:hypothetical protein
MENKFESEVRCGTTLFVHSQLRWYPYSIVKNLDFDKVVTFVSLKTLVKLKVTFFNKIQVKNGCNWFNL